MTDSGKKIFLTIAGSDCSGGAGIQVDMKAAFAFNYYACSAITAVTVQNSQGFYHVNVVSPSVLKDQIDAIAEDFTPDCVKIGLLPGLDIIETVGAALKEHRFKNVVVDPVISPTLRNEPLAGDEDLLAMTELIFPYVRMITPNVNEWEKLRNRSDLNIAGIVPNILITNGDSSGSSLCDLLITSESGYSEEIKFVHDKISTNNSHGTGCLLSSVIALLLGNGLSVEDSVRNAVDYVEAKLIEGAQIQLGRGNYGPVFI